MAITMMIMIPKVAIISDYDISAMGRRRWQWAQNGKCDCAAFEGSRTWARLRSTSGSRTGFVFARRKKHYYTQTQTDKLKDKDKHKHKQTKTKTDKQGNWSTHTMTQILFEFWIRRHTHTQERCTQDCNRHRWTDGFPVFFFNYEVGQWAYYSNACKCHD